MNWASWLLWGFVANILLTTVSSASQGLGLTRMNIPYMLGTIFTPNRDRAKLYGFLIHAGAGWLFSLFMCSFFKPLERQGGGAG